MTQVPALGTVPWEEEICCFSDDVGWGRCDLVGRATGRAGMEGLVSPRVWGTLCLASPAPETVKLIKAVEPQD